MQIDRSKNSVRNIVSGLISQLVTLILPFVIRTIILQTLGAAYTGLGGLYSSILQVLSLTELGFATAMVFSMYKPIAEDNTELVCALLKLYRDVYRVIGAVIMVLGLAVMPFFNYIITDEVPPDIDVYLLYLIYLFNTAISYFLFAYKSSILTAHVRSDISTNITTLTCFLQYGVQILILCVWKNYYAYILVTPIATILANYLRSRAVDKLYPQYSCRGKVDKASLAVIKKNIGGLFVHRIGSVVVNATDNIVIAIFFEQSFFEVTRYGNYYYIVTAVSGFLIAIYNAISAGVGNAVTTKTKEENYRDFMKFSFLNLLLVGWCTVCLSSLYQHFMTIWAPSYLYEQYLTVLLFCGYFYIYRGRAMTTSYKSAAGIYWEDKWCPLVSSAVNLVLDVVLVQYVGINGVILATVVSMLFVETPWEIAVLFKLYFKRSPKEFLLRQALYFLVTVLCGALTFLLCSLLPMPAAGEERALMSFVWFFCKLAICAVFPIAFYVLCYHRLPEGKSGFGFILQYLKRRLSHGKQ